MQRTATEYTYEWLATAFGSAPTLTKEQLIEKANLIKKLAIEEIDEFIFAVKHNDRAEMINACSDLLFVANNLPFLANITDEELSNENERVFRSNMTKFCKSKDEAEATVTSYSLGTHPNKLGYKIATVAMPTNNREYPYRVQTIEGKIMKSIFFKDVHEIDQ